MPWSWAEDRLVGERNYWLGAAGPGGRPHIRPVWAVWLDRRLWFSTGSPALQRAADGGPVTVHLDGGDAALILEGTAAPNRDPAALQAMCAVYGPKYDFPMHEVDGEIRDDDGTGGPVFVVLPSVVFGWESNMASATRWRFPRPGR